MNINWKLKSFAFQCVDTFSLHLILYFARKHITRRSRLDISAKCKSWLVHKENLATLQSQNVFEFGAGTDLSENIFLSQFFGPQTAVDLFALLDIDLVNEAAFQISRRYPEIAFHSMADLSDIERYYKVRYLAPFDAARTPFGDNAFDACVSTDTLEHIPEDSIIAIFQELRRIIRPEGLISAVIDYSDHYAYTDKSIGPLNYLQYSVEEFKMYNHNSYSQNRLRHHDYELIFRGLGYRLIRNEALDMAEMPRRISSHFDQSEPSLCAQRGIFLLQNSK
jgi:SAM-dependent methyltransferase